MSVIAAWFATQGAKLWGYVAAALAIVGGLLLMQRQAKKSGENEVVAEKAQKEVENAKVAREVEQKVDLTKSDAVRDELSKYRRD